MRESYRPPTIDYEVNSGNAMNEASVKCGPTTDYRLPTTKPTAVPPLSTVYPRPMTLAYMPRCPADPSLEGIQKLCSRKDQKRTNFIVKWMKYTEKGDPGWRFIRIRARKEMDRDSKHSLWMVSKMLKRFEVQGSRFKLWCGAQIKKRRKL